MNKFIVFVKFFFRYFRTFNFSRTVNRIYNHFFLFRSRGKMFVSVCNSSFHSSFILFNKLYYNKNLANMQGHKIMTSIQNGLDDVQKGKTKPIEKLWDEL